MSKEFVPSDFVTPHHVMKGRYPNWNWKICLLCEEPVAVREPYGEMHVDCYNSNAGKRLRKKNSLPTTGSLF